MKKITYLAAAIAFFSFASLDANAQTDKNKKKAKKKQNVEQTTEVETETKAETETQANYEEQVQTETQVATEQQTQTTTQPQTQDENVKREAITQEELPEPVKQTLSAATFSSWQIVEVYRVTPNENARGANAQGTENRAEQANQNAQNTTAQENAPGQSVNKTMYEVFFTNEQQQSAKVRIDEQGNIIRDQK